MSNITFQCTSCEADFEVGITHILERPTSIKCTHCGSRPSSNRAHSFAQALDDLLSSMAALRAKVVFELNLASDELPPPYGPPDDEEGGALGLVGPAASSSDDDDDEDSDDDDEDEDEDFDDEDDEDFEDDDFEFDDDDEEEEDDDLEEEEEEDERY